MITKEQLKPYMVLGKLTVSRKKLKQCMRDRPDLTSYALYRATGRKLGWGRTRKAMRDAEEREKTAREMRDIAQSKTKDAAVKASSSSMKSRIVGGVKRMLSRKGSRGS